MHYGTMECRMDKTESQVMPAPPNLVAALRAGFDAVANKIVIILIPIGLDLLLWLGPHLQMKTLLNRFFAALTSSTMNTQQTGDMFTSMVAVLNSIAAQFNLLTILRTYPVGIPSLMTSRLPSEIPTGAPISVDITNPLVILGVILSVLIVGLLIGTFYYILVAQVSMSGKLELRRAVHNWAWSSMQVVSLAAALALLFILISIPSSCIISTIALVGLPLGQFALFIYLGVLLWLAFPLLFSTHGIFVRQLNALVSVQRSMLLTRMTLSTTILFFVSIFAISEGLDILWRVPAEKSWLTLVGVGGHAFITSALLAASFIYYRDADTWAQERMRILAQNGMSIRGG